MFHWMLFIFLVMISSCKKETDPNLIPVQLQKTKASKVDPQMPSLDLEDKKEGGCSTDVDFEKELERAKHKPALGSAQPGCSVQ